MYFMSRKIFQQQHRSEGGGSSSPPTAKAESMAADVAPSSVSVIIAGVARAVPPESIKILIPKLIRMGQGLGNYHIVVYENDSSGPSRAAFEEELAKTPNSTYVHESGTALIMHGHLGMSNPRSAAGRTERIAAARNRMLDLVAEVQRREHHKFLIVTDLDGFCGPPPDRGCANTPHSNLV